MNLKTKDYVIIGIILILIFLIVRDWIWCNNNSSGTVVENFNQELVDQYEDELDKHKRDLQALTDFYDEPYEGYVKTSVEYYQEKIAELEAKIAEEKGESDAGSNVNVPTPVDQIAQPELNLSERELNELVTVTVTKILKEMMSRTDKIDWNVAAKKIGDSVENMIREYARVYGGMDKQEFARLVGRQASLMTRNLLANAPNAGRAIPM